MAVAVYVRVSTEEQRERQSILTQREFAERYCQLHTLAVDRVYADDGVSGTVPLDQRPEGGQILKDAQLGKFDQLLVYKLDRLGRETRLILNAVADLEKLGVRIRSMTEEFDTGTATGRLMLTLLSGFASHEREVIRERSVAGTNRVAEAGGWLGGIVPYGYRKVGEKRDAHIVISEEPIPGLAMSEADVIREVFRMAAVERKSCRVIATRLNDLRIPCAYVRDDRLTIRGKRKQRTSGVWRAGRIRGLITNKTYMGIHEFGKRAVSQRPVISRAVPAIVTESTWKKAQKTLRDNFLFSRRSARNQYLLRGLIKCGLCGLTYIGVAANRPNGKREFYYRCNGAHSPSVYSKLGRCQAKAVRGDHLEQQVWSDVETLLRNPEPVLQQLHARLESDAKGSDQIRKQVTRLEGLLAQKAAERSRVVGLFRRGRLTDADVDAQMDEIGKEETALEAQVAELGGRIAGADSIGASLGSAQALLEQLRKRLDEPVSWELKRHLIEVLVGGIRVDTVEEGGVRQTKTTVTYRFSQPDQPMPLVLPQSYPGSLIRIPTQPQTVGDHIRRRRLGLKMLQKDVAAQIGVDKTSAFNWEANTAAPEIRYMPAIIRFLGYNPLPEGTTWGERLLRQRTTLGLSQKEAAGRLGADPSTLARWEKGDAEPVGTALRRAERFLAGEEQPAAAARLAG
ncbi:MAG: recombinase family protein [Bryobacteraceae bacterium]|jgi:site-specific DNA recombinase